jgi:AraC-like DNA-binding protein
MIWEAKSMIGGSIDRRLEDSCGGCERRDPCVSLFRALRFDCAERPPRRRAGEAGPAPSRSPFLRFLDEVAQAIDRNVRPRPSAFTREVERTIEPMLALGPVRIDEVARVLGLSRQTLYRRLRAEGVTFEALLDGLRNRLAMKLIREEGVPVKEAAWRLGFSDPAAFSRAFKRWTGRSPRDFGPRSRS